MTNPTPTPEERLDRLEAGLASLQADLLVYGPALAQLRIAVEGLGIQAGQLRERHTLLESRMVVGLTDLQGALDAVNARRPPVRRKLQELEDRLDEVAPPAPPAGEDGGTDDPDQTGLPAGPTEPKRDPGNGRDVVAMAPPEGDGAKDQAVRDLRQ